MPELAAPPPSAALSVVKLARGPVAYVREVLHVRLVLTLQRFVVCPRVALVLRPVLSQAGAQVRLDSLQLGACVRMRAVQRHGLAKVWPARSASDTGELVRLSGLPASAAVKRPISLRASPLR